MQPKRSNIRITNSPVGSPNISRHRQGPGSPTTGRKKPPSKLQQKKGTTRKPTSGKRVTLKDFIILQKIGKGGYGEVYLVKHKNKSKRLALKQMQKELISKSDKIEHIKNEREILIRAKSPFLIRLHYSFQDSDCLYLAMEYCPGGDLRALLDGLGTLEEEDAQLYFAEMIQAVHALHEMGYLHRDLKPENFLIAEDGHLKLADFGLSKSMRDKTKNWRSKKGRSKAPASPSAINRRSLMPDQNVDYTKLNRTNFDAKFRRTRAPSNFRKSVLPNDLKPQKLDRRSSMRMMQNPRFRAYSVVGSPDYMSPEVLGDGGYGEEIDWWSLGCCFFEMIMGIPPFTGDTPDEVFDNIRDWRHVIPALLEQYKLYMTPECFSLVSGLLSEPKTRLGSNIQSLRAHPFFTLEWEKITELEPPFVPRFDDPDDTSAFASRMEGIERDGDLMSLNGNGGN